MSYVDAGYTIVLVVLGLYAVSLLARRRRLERAAARGAPAPTRDIRGPGVGERATGGHHNVRVADGAARESLG